MHFPSLPTALLLTLALHRGVNAAAASDSDKKAKPLEPCTVSSSTGAFYDLRSLAIRPPADDKKTPKGAKTDDWNVRGFDYHEGKVNFTMNICAPLVDQISGFKGVDSELWNNVSAYYKVGSKKYSLG